jgi:hypothetical protein
MDYHFEPHADANGAGRDDQPSLIGGLTDREETRDYGLPGLRSFRGLGMRLAGETTFAIQN